MSDKNTQNRKLIEFICKSRFSSVSNLYMDDRQRIIFHRHLTGICKLFDKLGLQWDDIEIAVYKNDDKNEKI